MADEEFKWPSERVAQGGLFHPAKVKYSKETNDLLNRKYNANLTSK